MTQVLSITALSVAVIAFIAVLGVMREVVVLRGELDRRDHVSPSYLGSRVPPAMAAALSDHDRCLEGRAFILLFVSGGCSSCMALLDDLQASSQDRKKLVAERTVVVAMGGKSAVEDQLRSLGISTVSSEGDPERIVELAEVEATPSALLITNPGFVATEHRIGVGLEWMISRAMRIREGSLELTREG